jgi:hypothetical protein
VDRKTSARIAALEKWARWDAAAGTAAARKAFMGRFEREVIEADPNVIRRPREVIRRAELLKRAYFLRLAAKSAEGRAARKARRRAAE